MLTVLTAFLALSGGESPLASQFLELPCQFLPESVGHIFTTIVQTEDGRSHLFLVDTGSAESWIAPGAVGRSSVQGSETRLNLRLQSPTSNDSEVVTFKASVDLYGVDSAIKHDLRGVSVEGTLGLNAISHGQLMLDYAQDRVWLRLGHPNALTAKRVGSLLGTSVGVLGVEQPPKADSVLAVPLTKSKLGSFTVGAEIGGKTAQLTVDTGTEVLALHKRKFAVASIQSLGSSGGMTSKGDYQAVCGVSPATSVGKWLLPWPSLYQDEDDEDDDGVISPSQFGVDVVLLDFRSQMLYLKVGSVDDWCVSCLFQLTGLRCRIMGDQLWMVGDGGEKALASFKNEQIASIRSTPIVRVLADLRDQWKGSKTARDRLFRLLITQWPMAEIMILDDGRLQGIRFPRHA